MPRRAARKENGLSGSPDEQKIRKTTFRDAPTGRSEEKLAVGMSRNPKKWKNEASGGPDEQKIRKMTFRP